MALTAVFLKPLLDSKLLVDVEIKVSSSEEAVSGRSFNHRHKYKVGYRKSDPYSYYFILDGKFDRKCKSLDEIQKYIADYDTKERLIIKYKQKLEADEIEYQKEQERCKKELRKWEQILSSFIDECSKVNLNSLTDTQFADLNRRCLDFQTNAVMHILKTHKILGPWKYFEKLEKHELDFVKNCKETAQRYKDYNSEHLQF